MRINDLHRRLLADVVAIGSPYPLVLTGGYAVQAHGLVERLSDDLDLATEAQVPMAEIAAALRRGLIERGWRVSALETEPISARMVVSNPETGEECEVDVLKETMARPPLQTAYGPVLALDDVVGTKVRALAARGYPRDLVDVHAASATGRWSRIELEELGRSRAWDDFDLTDLRARLETVELLDDRLFAAYGLDEEAIAELRRWAQEWSDDIGERLMEEAPYEEPPEEPSED
ncbi:nucleotidyl transferase AbiEii/AbiGii toxin family protein [Streptomyces sp. NPDC049585]|uniref:nucleotidyl transferase AbiEii/AbiGii toxin family protein n=1 Tax=Streptomyces sp. NPDC049585 TaxID=3155154 RepID=UPI00343C73DE